MFIRFRRVRSDGYIPNGVQAKKQCTGRCKSRRDAHCPMKPRCRWRIGYAVPYRLHVQIVENHRVAGKVRQEVIADLGSIDGHYLSEFWEGCDASLKADNWFQHSVAARIAFWKVAKERLDRLSNRLDPKAMRMAIHARIPWPKQNERDLAEARTDFARLHSTYQTFFAGRVERNEAMIADLTAVNDTIRKEGAALVSDLNRAAQRLSRLTDRT